MASTNSEITKQDTDSLLQQFQFTSLLNTDSGGKRIILRGTIHQKPALLLVERAAFSTDPSHLTSLPTLLTNIQNLGQNDIYSWYLANTKTQPSSPDGSTPPADLKINLIWPCTEKHVRKYSFQQTRVVTEPPSIYTKYVRPYMELCREEGRLNWVFNILDGKAEQENVLYRSNAPQTQDDFLLLPDLNWDRTTLSSLHLLALPLRRDIWSVRDLKKEHVPWLKHLLSTLRKTISAELYPGVEEDMLKFYVHYQPTYYHFHVHVVHVNLDAGATQAVGKASGLENVISQLECMSGGEGEGMDKVELTYTLGENSELWERIFLPLKEGREPNITGVGGN